MISDFFSDEKKHVVSVKELNQAARQLVENGFSLLWVRGEISNFTRAASGHWYFSIKDDQAQVRCVMFRHKSQWLSWQPVNGMLVDVLALPTLYEARGEFQLTLEQMRQAGLGALYEAFERLKQKLEAEGLFDAARKRALPLLPLQIGVITSPQAAALRDVLTTLNKRMPGVPVVLYPTPVQGEGAAQKIARAIGLANERAECDVLLLSRGGGSIEDLWSFNDEAVARAIAASKIPVITGIGHDTDITIADFVADQRAATPTAAAQAAVPSRQELMQRLQQSAGHLSRSQRHSLEQAMQTLDTLQQRLIHPAQRLQQQDAQVGQLQQRLQRAIQNHTERMNWRIGTLWQQLRGNRPAIQPFIARQHEAARRLQQAMNRIMENTETGLRRLEQHLHHLNPQQVLARGYSLVRDEHGAIVSDSTTLAVGARLDITFDRGRAGVVVRETDHHPESSS